jgi:hypothetical protein
MQPSPPGCVVWGMQKTLILLVSLLCALPGAAAAQQAAPQVDLSVSEEFPPESCHGDTFISSNDFYFQLLGCVEDEQGNPVDTSQNELYLEWRAPEGLSLSHEPNESDAGGQVATTASITSPGEYEVELVLCSGTPCGQLSTASVLIEGSWHGDPPCAFNGTSCYQAFLGTPHRGRVFLAIGSSIAECMDGRPLLLKRERTGRDEIILVRQASDFGESSARVRDRWRGFFYVVAPRWEVETTEGLKVCERERSRSVRIK